MRAWATGDGGIAGLTLVEREVPTPGPGELLVRVSVCGVCRTDLHVVERDLSVHRSEVVPGHEVVGQVVRLGADVREYAVGDRVGIAWLRRTCGRCRWCRSGRENLCPESSYTGWDADGGYAEYAVVAADFAYRLPEGYEDEAVAPLLCAGIIGYRSLLRAQLPPAGRLGIYGFGGSAHLTAQIAIQQGARVHVFTRSAESRGLAQQLGAISVQGSGDPAPEPLDAAIVFAPAGDLVPVALAALDRGGTLALAGIHMSDIPAMSYQRHLFYERQVRSVTSNTRADGDELLRLAAALPLQVQTTAYPLQRADQALRDLKDDAFAGAAVLHVS